MNPFCTGTFVLVFDDRKASFFSSSVRITLFWFLNRYGHRRRSGRREPVQAQRRCSSLGCSGIAVADLIRIQPIVCEQAVKTLQAVFAGVGDAAAQVLLTLARKALVGDGDRVLGVDAFTRLVVEHFPPHQKGFTDRRACPEWDRPLAAPLAQTARMSVRVAYLEPLRGPPSTMPPLATPWWFFEMQLALSRLPSNPLGMEGDSVVDTRSLQWTP